MLLGYNKENGNIEFLFSDDGYLKKQFPDNTASISDFWKGVEYNLTEIFIEEKDFKDFRNYNLYKILNGKIKTKNKGE